MYQELQTSLFGYQIIKYLGKGKSAYSYLIDYEGHPAVLKHIHYENLDVSYHFEENKLTHELNSYKQLGKTSFLYPKVLTYDDENQYLIKEYIEGELLLDYIAKGDLDYHLYLSVLHSIMLAEINGMNIDYFPTNFVIKDQKLYYIDYEVNAYSTAWDFRHWGIYMWMNVEGAKSLSHNHSYAKIVTPEGKSDVFKYHPFLENAIYHLDIMDYHQLLIREAFKSIDITSFELVEAGMAAHSLVIRAKEKDFFVKLYEEDHKTSYQEEVKAFHTLKELMPTLFDHFVDHRGFSYMIMEYIKHINIACDDEALPYAMPITKPLIELHQLTKQDDDTSLWLDGIIKNLQVNEIIAIEPQLKPLLTYLKDYQHEVKNGDMALLHGDYHLWNVLLTNNRTYMIDVHLRLGDIRLDVYWTYTLMKRSGYPKFADAFLKIYQEQVPKIDENRLYFIVLSNVLWFQSIMHHVKSNEHNMFHEFTRFIFELDEIKQIAQCIKPVKDV